MRNKSYKLYRCKLCGGRAYSHQSFELHGNGFLETVYDDTCENGCHEKNGFGIEEDGYYDGD